MDKKQTAEFLKLLNRLYVEQVKFGILKYYKENNLKIKE